MDALIAIFFVVNGLGIAIAIVLQNVSEHSDNSNL
jgi:hypothetical protein